MSRKTKIIVRIKGGLGNQLFCYAAARRLALVNDAELVLDDVTGFVRDFVYKRHFQLDHFDMPIRKATPSERLEPFSRHRHALNRWWNARRPFDRRQCLNQEGFDFDPRLLSLKPRGTLYLEGYWQSEDYFKDVAPIIRQDLRIKSEVDAPNHQMAHRMQQQQSVAVHVRFFDTASDASGSANAPSHYYRESISQMETRRPGAHYYVFSDRPAQARDCIPLPDERVTLVSHNQGDANAHADLWLMTQCQHFIIANSTFSWWGAWLGNRGNSIIMAPNPARFPKDSPWRAEGTIPGTWRKV